MYDIAIKRDLNIDWTVYMPNCTTLRMRITFSSATVIPLLNLRCDSKEMMVLVRRTFTVGLVTMVTWPSIIQTIGTKLLVKNDWKRQVMRHINQWDWNWCILSKLQTYIIPDKYVTFGKVTLIQAVFLQSFSDSSLSDGIQQQKPRLRTNNATFE